MIIVVQAVFLKATSKLGLADSPLPGACVIGRSGAGQAVLNDSLCLKWSATSRGQVNVMGLQMSFVLLPSKDPVVKFARLSSSLAIYEKRLCI